MAKIRTILLALGLVAIVAIAAFLLLQACGLGKLGFSGFSRFCPAPVVLQERETLVALHQQTETLERRIAFLEKELAAKQCTAQYPQGIETPAAAPTIDNEAWKRRDLAALEGCWILDSEYRTTHVRTGAITSYKKWTMCFDASGHGTQEMLSTDGAVSCNGPVSGAFDSMGKLVIKEASNLPCSNNSYIFRRITSCVLDTDGTASCKSRHPDRGGEPSLVRLRRAIGGQ